MSELDVGIENIPTEVGNFKIKEMVQATPLKDPVVQTFLGEWCRVHDDKVTVQFLPRREWSKKWEMHNIFAALSEGRTSLTLPEDLHLWEMVGVLKLADKDLGQEKSHLQKEQITRIETLGKSFRNSGIYLASRLNCLNEGKTIASNLARDFYSYGQSLLTEIEPQEINIDEIDRLPLTPQETEEIDRWLAGDDLYHRRHARVESRFSQTNETGVSKESLTEEERRRSLQQFFSIAQRALDRMGSQDSADASLIQKVEKNIKDSVEIPAHQLTVNMFFQHGMSRLLHEIGLTNSVSQQTSITIPMELWSKAYSEIKLISVFDIEKFKHELEGVKEKPGVTPEEIATKELEIAAEIQKVVSAYDYEKDNQNPTDIIAKRTRNCVGASMLGGALLSEIGIGYLVCDLPQHSITFLVTSDRRVFWQDLLSDPSYNIEIKDQDIEGVTVAEIVDFYSHPQMSGLRMKPISDRLLKAIPENTDLAIISDYPLEEPYLTAYEPFTGLIIQTLNNTGVNFAKQGSTQEAVEALKLATAIHPRSTLVYEYLGDLLRRLDRNQEAARAYNEALAINPNSEKLNQKLNSVKQVN
ncbi:tetratricopeptide repeat protein [Candidatus Microgenomates bacterium]|nr:MAG: tetratricopeptide repeat protein [Candidatus Microgenomates bacterium]